MPQDYTVNQLLKDLSIGREIEFEYDGVVGTICNEKDGWIYYGGNFGNSAYYSSGEELVNSHKIKESILINLFKRKEVKVTTIF